MLDGFDFFRYNGFSVSFSHPVFRYNESADMNKQPHHWPEDKSRVHETPLVTDARSSTLLPLLKEGSYRYQYLARAESLLDVGSDSAE